MNTPHSYLIPEAVQQDLQSFTVPDVLSVYGGETYKNIKTAVSSVIVHSSSEDQLANAMNQLKEVCRAVKAVSSTNHWKKGPNFA